METITLSNDINVFYVTAKSFPDGVMEAHNKLRALVPNSTDRKYFGLSRPEHDVIVYKAAAEEMSGGEAERLHCKTLSIKKGKYICLTIPDYMKDAQSIGESFRKLLAHPNLDPNGYCVEWYINDTDVKCMIRLNE